MRRRLFLGLGALLNIILGPLQGALGNTPPPPRKPLEPSMDASMETEPMTIRLGRARWAWSESARRWVLAAEKHTEFSMGPWEPDAGGGEIRRPVIGETKWHTHIDLPSWRDSPKALSPRHFVTAAWQTTGRRGGLMSYCLHHGGPGPDLNAARICAYCRKEIEDDAGQPAA